MTVMRRQLGAKELDHEVLWGWVFLASGVLATVCVSTIGPPPWFCLFRSITGIPCPTCGATRALAALVDGRVVDSLALNPFVPLGAVAAALYTPYALAAAHLGLPRIRIVMSPRENAILGRLSAASAALIWIYLIADGR